ncbi:calpain-10 isoform X2 [Ambystoma mexicanum]|uniref:calpain-10 isoform X2 n=1 Tax=Ambystoma mexicanum TaxID=8296 RepID=UPI0037E79A28
MKTLGTTDTVGKMNHLICLTPERTLHGGTDICPCPRLFPDKAQEGQVKQGILGDCWFLCACAVLQRNESLRAQVFPPGQPGWTEPGYTGHFTCRFWQFGQWVEITIDDRLPCIAGQLCFSRCQPEDVFWLPLLEKAYAKLHGSYELLWAGQVADALVDLTGGLAERWTLVESTGSPDTRIGISTPESEVFKRLMDLKDRCLISCSVLRSMEDASELGEFHAFVVTDIRDLGCINSEELVLLRIQNPWGRRCWNGTWREGGEGWTKLDKMDASDLLSQVQEGEFWVEKAEFLQRFDEVTVGYPMSEAGHIQSLHTDRWLCHTQQLSGSWVKGQSAGGSRNNSSFPSNPKFWLRVSEQSEVCIALLQCHKGPGNKRPRLDWAARSHRCVYEDPEASSADLKEKYTPAVGLHMWKVEKRRFNLLKALSESPVAGTKCHSYDREVHLRRILTPGHYLLVPSTFLKDVDGQFLLRAFSTGRIHLSEIKPLPGTAVGCMEELPTGAWERVQLTGRWESGKTAGGSRNFTSYHTNPSFPLSICDGLGNQNVKVLLRQHCCDNEINAIGFHVFQEASGIPRVSSQQEPVASCVPHRYAQEVSLQCTLPPGQYRVIPSTYHPGQEADFTLTLATRIERKPRQCRETLGQVLQELSVSHVMKR